MVNTIQMSAAHAAAWRRFQSALCAMGTDTKRYRNLLNSPRHYDAVRILGRGTEEELKAEMYSWRVDYAELFEQSTDQQHLEMKEFTVNVMTVPPVVHQKLFGAETETKQIKIKGYTLEDAKRRAGIE